MAGTRHLLSLLALAVLAGCGSTVQTSQFGAGPTVTANAFGDPQAQANTPAQLTAEARAMTDISAFLDPAIVPQLNQNSRDHATGAQYNALQFGRPGAPRNWQGDNGASGQVTVGPYVRVNNIDCRDFTHAVTLSGQTYLRKGTACREADGRWSVAENSSG